MIRRFIAWYQGVGIYRFGKRHGFVEITKSTPQGSLNEKPAEMKLFKPACVA
jgi:hypothetical protein